MEMTKDFKLYHMASLTGNYTQMVGASLFHNRSVSLILSEIRGPYRIMMYGPSPSKIPIDIATAKVEEPP